jgi:hypothetical protein
MRVLHTSFFRILCRLLAFALLFQSLHPAALGVPKTLDFKIRTSDAGLIFDFGLVTFDFGVTPAYGQAQDPLLALTPGTACGLIWAYDYN